MLDLTPLLKQYAKYRSSQLSSFDPSAIQEAQLLKLVRKAAYTRFGNDHGFLEIKNVSDFQKRVPLRKYEAFWEDYLKKDFPRWNNVAWPGVIPFIPVSSGTTSGTTKYIPLSHEMVKSNSKAAFDMLVHHITNRPASRVLGGRSFYLGSSTALVRQAPGIYSGDLSGIINANLPFWIRSRYFPSKEKALIGDWEKKIDILGRESLQQNVRILGGVPAWLLLLFRRLFEIVPQADGKLANIYPGLELLVHGGVSFAPYYEQFKALLDGSHAELREVYPASEGFIAVADRGSGEGLRVNLDMGMFFEFVPLDELDQPNPTRHWIANIEKDVNYAVVMSTCAGLWSYIIGDTVRFVDLNPPRLLITGRTAYYLSAFGEHLIAEEVEDGVSTAAGTIGANVSDYSVGALYPQHPGELGGHLFVLEFAGAKPGAEQLKTFSAALDKKLSERNEDYAAHRVNNFGLNPPQLLVAPPGTFAAWMKSRGKLGGQNKVPRIITDQKLFQGLREFAEQKGDSSV